MSQADLSQDHGSDDPLGPSPPVSPPIVPPPPVIRQPAEIPSVANPPATQPPITQPSIASAPPANQPVRPVSNRPPVVPPPPPPRSTLPPVRAIADATVASGVGSARGVRWRGELDSIKASAMSRPASANAGSAVGVPADTLTPEDLSDPGSDRHRWSAPPWLVSLVLHLVFLLVLALITTPVGTGLGKLMLTIGTSDAAKSVELTEFEIAADDTLIESDSLMDSEFEVDVDLSSALEPVETTLAPELSDWFPNGITEASSEISKPMFSGRTGAMKAALLAMYGGTAETQDAVKRGLEWLKRNQNSKGGWSMKGPYGDGNHSENEASATAMALLAFLGDGHTHRSGDYVDEIDKAMKYLVKMQDRSGFMAGGARGHEQMYSQAQATIALCELYGMTKDSWLRPRVELAVDFAQKAQSDQGGWRYVPRQDSDTSVTGWFLLALKSAESAGLEVHDSKIRDINRYLDSAQSYDGAAYAYQPRGAPTPAMTAEGLLCRQYLGWQHDDVPMVRGVEALSLDFPFDRNDQDVYYWYYATQVMHHYGGTPWKKWNDVLKTELPAMQIRGGREDGSWPPQGDAYGSYGRIYTTCLSIYCLEVYYRHLPLYKMTD